MYEVCFHVCLWFQAQFKVDKVSETTNMIECEGIGHENSQVWGQHPMAYVIKWLDDRVVQ